MLRRLGHHRRLGSEAQPGGWLGATEKVDWPILTNLRLDPYERTGMFNGKDNGSIAYYNWFVYEFWRFVFVQQEVAKAAQTRRRLLASICLP